MAKIGRESDPKPVKSDEIFRSILAKIWRNTGEISIRNRPIPTGKKTDENCSKVGEKMAKTGQK